MPTKKPKKKVAEPRADLHLWMHAVDARLDEVVRLLVNIVNKGDSIMANLQEVKDELAALKTDIDAEHVEVQGKLGGIQGSLDAALVQIQALMDQIAAGSSVTAADLDALKASITESRTGVQGISEAIAAPPAP
jgi:hypothetical protein